MRGEDSPPIPLELEDALVAVAALDGDDRHRALDSLRAAHPESVEFLDLWEREVAPMINSRDPKTNTDDPEWIGPYRVLGRLGSGGMGTVYKAEQLEPVRRDVAIKVVQRGLATKEVLARFALERQALAAMNHRYIAKVFDAGATADGQPFFVMEYIEGSPFATYCDARKLPLRDRLELFCMVCQGVQHAHQKGVIHRDLKPGNVLIVREGDEAVPKVLDFGLAKATKRNFLAGTMRTEENQVLGTPEYMAPEQAAGDNTVVDSRADVYSLGVMLYELLTGELPFPTAQLREAGALDALRLICEQDPPKPSTQLSSIVGLARDSATKRRMTAGALSRALKGDLDWIVMCAMAKEPERRYDSATSFALDVQRYLDHRPVEAGPPSARYRLRKFARRYRLQLVAAGLVFVALTVGVIGTTIGLLDARRQHGIANANAEVAERRALELERVTEFQASQLREIDPMAMAVDLRRGVLSEVRAAMGRRGTQEIDDQVERLDRLLYGTNFTNVALEVLAANLFERAESAIDSEFEDQPLVQARLWQSVATTLRELGLLAMADRPQHRALEVRRARLGDDHRDTLSSINEAGRLLEAQGRFDAAEPLFREALKGRRRLFGERHPLTLAVMSNLGLLLRARGHFAEATPLLLGALDGMRAEFGDDHRLTLISINNVARLLQSQQESAEAEPLFRAALDGRRRLLGPDHPDTLTSINNLGVLLEEQGRPSEAEPLFRAALEGFLGRFGDDHPDTVTARANLGAALEAQGKLSEAEPLLREALAGMRAVLGDSHPKTLHAIDSLAELLELRRELTEALQLRREALAGRRVLLGDRDALTVASIERVADLRRARRELAEAAPLYREALEAKRAALGDRDPSTLESMSELGRCLAAMGELREAETLLRDVLAARRTLPGPADPSTLRSMNNLALVLKKRGDLSAAESLYREALEGMRKELGDDHPNTLSTIGNLGILLKVQGRLDEAEPLYREALERRHRVFGERHKATLASLSNLTALLIAQGRSGEAEPLCREVLEARREVLGDRHPHTLDSIHILATILVEQRELARAEPLSREALTRRRAVLGDDHRDTKISRGNLALLLVEKGKRHLGAGELADAASALTEAHALMTGLWPDDDRRRISCEELLLQVYEAWDASEPGAGHDAEAARWRALRSENR